MRFALRSRVRLIGTFSILVALIAIAFAVGGSGSSSNATSGAGATTSYSLDLPTDGVGVGTELAPIDGDAGHSADKNLPRTVAVGGAPTTPQMAEAPESAPDYSSTSSGGGSSAAGDTAKVANSGDSLDATRIVKTGNLTIRVPKTGVQSATQALTALATAQGGYVSQSNTSLDTSSPYSEVVLRVPVAHFQDAIAAAEKLGQKVVALTTSADDITGKYVDLAAKRHALERTRETYLTILSRARTIGETLAVQQRIDDVQQQIDQLHGQLKLLANQSSYSTLTVDVVPAGAKPFAATHHQRSGISKAWHDSWSRFGRGVNAIVGAIGPIVFAILFLALLGLIGYGGYRGFRRATRPTQAAS